MHSSTAFKARQHPFHRVTRPNMFPTTILTLASFLISPTLAAVVGPVLSTPFPDPSIIKLSNTSYAFSSRTGGHASTTLINTPIASSPYFQSACSLLPPPPRRPAPPGALGPPTPTPTS